ncbi:MAG: hypothetical protein FWE22_06835 [Firmicutes bacterium]|nr:hypothetical protein [Bacillota bacterium]
MLDLIFAIIFLTILLCMFGYVLWEEIRRQARKRNTNVIEVTSCYLIPIYGILLLVSALVILPLLVFPSEDGARTYMYPLIFILIIIALFYTRVSVMRKVVVDKESKIAIVSSFFGKKIKVNIQDIKEMRMFVRGMLRARGHMDWYSWEFYADEKRVKIFSIHTGFFRDKRYTAPVEFLLFLLSSSKCKVFHPDGEEWKIKKGKRGEKEVREMFAGFLHEVRSSIDGIKSNRELNRELREMSKAGKSSKRTMKNPNYKAINESSALDINSFVTGEIEPKLLSKYVAYLDNITEDRKISDYLTHDEFFIIFENMALCPFVFIHEEVCFVISNGEDMGCEISFTSASEEEFDEKEFEKNTITYNSPEELFEKVQINEKSLKEIWSELTAG